MKAAAQAAGGVVRRALTPAAEQGTVRGLVLDLTRSRRELLAENTFLRHQLLVAARQAKRPKLRATDRLVLVGLTAMFATPTGQRWSTFLRNQAAGIWCCDLFEVRDLWFRGLPGTKTNKSRRVIPLHPVLAEALAKDRKASGVIVGEWANYRTSGAIWRRRRSARDWPSGSRRTTSGARWPPG
jgi:hypothetical protein